jgi:ADP-ribose pyrophosphatase YjhB (NUDIX family)
MAERFEVRPAAKAIISTEDGLLVLVAGHSRRINLPGGGIKPVGNNIPGESPLQALYRELKKELGLEDTGLANVQPAFDYPLIGETTSSDGKAGQAEWHVFSADLITPFAALQRPPDSEITNQYLMTVDKCLASPNVLKLAKRAVRLFFS